MGRLTPTVGIEFHGKKDSARCRVDTRTDGKVMRGAEPGVLGGGVEESRKGRERSRRDKGWNS